MHALTAHISKTPRSVTLHHHRGAATLHKPALALQTQTPSRLRCVSCRADLSSMLDTAITWGALCVSAGAAAYALFHTWPSSKQGQPGTLSSEEDNMTWAIMGGVSCIPLFNSMAWVLGALQSDSPRPFYWAAALYSLPLLRNGLDQDWFSLSLLLLGVLHMQALRIGATESDLQAKLQQQLKPLAVINTLASAAGSAASAAIGTGTGSTGSNGGGSSKQQLEAGGSRRVSNVLEGDAYEQEEVLRRQEELQDFDRRLQQLSDKQDNRNDGRSRL